MCGIAGFVLREPDAVPRWQLELLARELLSGIANRGQDATGVLALSDSGERLWRKAACSVWDFLPEWRRFPDRTCVVLLHTRLATQGHESFPENNHPLRRGTFYAVHNGHVWNDSELLPSWDRDGKVDSEAIPYLFAQAGSLSAASSVLRKLQGDAAIAVADAAQPTALTVARGRYSPLAIHESQRLTAFASTQDALTAAWLRTFGGNRKRPLGRSLPEGAVIHYRTGEPAKRETVKLPLTRWEGSWQTPAQQAAGSFLATQGYGSRSYSDAPTLCQVGETCDGCDSERYSCEDATIEGILLRLCYTCRQELAGNGETWQGTNLTL